MNVPEAEHDSFVLSCIPIVKQPSLKPCLCHDKHRLREVKRADDLMQLSHRCFKVSSPERTAEESRRPRWKSQCFEAFCLRHLSSRHQLLYYKNQVQRDVPCWLLHRGGKSYHFISFQNRNALKTQLVVICKVILSHQVSILHLLMFVT